MTNRVNHARTIVAAVALFGTGFVQAMDISPTGKLGVDFGGDTLVTVFFADGSSDNIDTNEGLYFGGGVSAVNDAGTLEIEATLSYKFSFITAENGDVDWTRLPLDLMAFHRFQKIRVGAGITYHLNPKLTGTGVIGGLNIAFKDALGFVLAADYRLSDKGYLGLRYTALDYEVETAGLSGEASADGVGIVIGTSF